MAAMSRAERDALAKDVAGRYLADPRGTIRTVAFETGLSQDVVYRLLRRHERVTGRKVLRPRGARGLSWERDDPTTEG